MEANNVRGQCPIPVIVVLVNLINPVDISVGRDATRFLHASRAPGRTYRRKSVVYLSNLRSRSSRKGKIHTSNSYDE